MVWPPCEFDARSHDVRHGFSAELQMALMATRREGFGVAVILGGETAQLDAIFRRCIDPKSARQPCLRMVTYLKDEENGPC